MFKKLFSRSKPVVQQTIPNVGDNGLLNLVTYAHVDAPNGTRFRNFIIDGVPAWAVDVRIDHSRD
jgi:hypothetical protein